MLTVDELLEYVPAYPQRPSPEILPTRVLAVEDRDLTVQDQRARLEPLWRGRDLGEAAGQIPPVPAHEPHARGVLEASTRQASTFSLKAQPGR